MKQNYTPKMPPRHQNAMASLNQNRRSVIIVAVSLLWFIVIGPFWLIYTYLIMPFFTLPSLSIIEMTAIVCAVCLLDIMINGAKK